MVICLVFVRVFVFYFTCRAINE